MPTGRVHLLYGLAGSGKSTLARELCADGRGVRFTLDEWMLRLFPDLHFATQVYGERAAEVRDVIWSVAEQVVGTGADVVLDWNSWSVARRRWAVERATAVGASVILHRLPAGLETACSRIRQRTADEIPYTHSVGPEDNRRLAALMEEPSIDEHIEIYEH